MPAKIVLIIFLLNILLITPSENGRILAIMPTPSYSHQIVFNPLWLALNLQGHHITLFTTDPIKNVNFTNFRQVDWSFAYKLWHEKHNASEIITNFNANFLKCISQYEDMMSDIFIQELEHPEVKKIVRDENEHFDLVIAEFLNPVMIAFSRKFNCPFIGVSPMDITNFVHETLNNPISPALFPDFLSKFDSNMNIVERTINTFHYLAGKVYFKYYFYPKMDNIVRQYFGENTPTLEDIQADVSMVFLNINPILHNIRPLMGNVLMIGGGTHLAEDASLNSDIQEFLDEAKNGAIYCSLGTNLKSKYLLETTKSVFLETFTELPYSVLWKFEESLSINSTNVLIRDWLPQQQILKHPNVKLFITQGGLQSLEEAIYNSLPIIAMPAFVDQHPNVRRLVRLEMGIKLDFDQVEKKQLKNAIKEVITNPKYKQSSTKLFALLREHQPIPGISQAVWWTEYVLTYKGVQFMKHSKIPIYQYLLLDVLALIFCIAAISITLSYVVVKIILKRIQSKRRGKLIKLE